jgi:hypothetical protein
MFTYIQRERLAACNNGATEVQYVHLGTHRATADVACSYTCAIWCMRVRIVVVVRRLEEKLDARETTRTRGGSQVSSKPSLIFELADPTNQTSSFWLATSTPSSPNTVTTRWQLKPPARFQS